ncbi:MAG: hypothetical protein JSV17_13415 [Candidatus Aminicenantes bacterium]|nr:MAG: hypothetical protein JSV17_13415 [Candidatus Aminicenantes bacterium]
MKSKITFLVLFVFCLSIAFSFEKTERMSLSADGIDKLVIDCGSGFLHVTGENSLRSIEVEAEIIVKGKNEKDIEDYVKDRVKLELKKQGSKAILVSTFKNQFPNINFRTRVINLTVRIPNNMDVEVDDGSGEVNVKDIDGNLQIDDGSGEITVRDIRGDVNIHDGSGMVDIRNVTGGVSVDDGSGTIKINDIGKNVKVSDGSGSIYIDDVVGDVIIKEDGSGSVNIQNVKGRVVK